MNRWTITQQFHVDIHSRILPPQSITLGYKICAEQTEKKLETASILDTASLSHDRKTLTPAHTAALTPPPQCFNKTTTTASLIFIHTA